MSIPVCPTCERPLSSENPIRICWKCKKPILRGHKWIYLNVNFPGIPPLIITTIQHKHCADPQAYVTTEQEPIDVSPFIEYVPNHVFKYIF